MRAVNSMRRCRLGQWHARDNQQPGIYDANTQHQENYAKEKTTLKAVNVELNMNSRGGQETIDVDLIAQPHRLSSGHAKLSNRLLCTLPGLHGISLITWNKTKISIRSHMKMPENTITAA